MFSEAKRVYLGEVSKLRNGWERALWHSLWSFVILAHLVLLSIALLGWPHATPNAIHVAWFFLIVNGSVAMYLGILALGAYKDG